MKRGYLVLTGATGLLGQYLLRDLLQQGERVAVIVRGSKSQSAAERMERVMQHWERTWKTSLPRPVCLTGDITQPLAGLDESSLQWLRDQADRMLHCAASLTFQEHHGEPWRTNVEGTRHVVDLCQRTAIDDMHYISTAYVCGRRDDRVMEDELDVGQEFRNDYEKSKFLAEKLVRESPAFRQLTVYRPVVITGDSQSGYTSTYHGTYLYMKLAAVLARNVEPDENGKRHIPIRWGASGKERRNITPVDWNSQVICHLLHRPEAHGHTFHLAPASPLSMRTIIEYATTFFQITGIEFCGYGDQPDFKLNELERWIWSNVKIYGSYDFMDPEFDMTNLLRFLPNLPSPPLDYTIAERLMRYAEEDRWGKRKPPRPRPAPIVVESTLRELVQQTAPAEGDTIFGINITGPGGGQYQLVCHQGQVTACQRGLPSTNDRCMSVELTSDDLASLHQDSATQGNLLNVLWSRAIDSTACNMTKSCAVV